MKYEILVKELKVYNAELVAVSKKKTIFDILKLYDKGQRIFGENRVQELIEKQPKLPKDIKWHMIGNLQRNKVKHIASIISLIHSVDSKKLLKEINKQALKHERIIPVLLEFHIAKESSKSGFDLDKVKQMLSDESIQRFENVQIEGVMGMATFTSDEAQIRTEFSSLKQIFDELKSKFFSDKEFFKTISMGMSADYPIALEEGANMVRIGSLIFGPRD